MKFNRFLINIFLRIILIVLTCILFVYFIERDDNLLTSVFVAFLVLIQTIFLIRYVNRTNQELAEFLLHLQQGDTSLLFSKENIEKTFKGLRASFEKITTDVKLVQKEKEQNEHYLNYVIDNITTGLLAFNESGDIEFVNKQAKIFLNKSKIRLLNINSLDKEFIDILNEEKSAESQILKKTINDELYYLAFNSSEFKIDNKEIRFFTIHDVKREIESSEIESWQKLTSVLTHEMMNSITPITSLAHAIKRHLKRNNKLTDQIEINDELISDITENADIIETRGKGLLKFIDNYRTITKLPKPKFETIETKKFLHKIVQLFNTEINKKNIDITVNTEPEGLSILADKGMIEQVAINLIKNSIEALETTQNPEIRISAFKNSLGKTKIAISDNGMGINEENTNNIFTPFFTTKEKGSGVGLSLSRQIMHLHNGSISVKSEPDVETVFTLYF